MIYRKAKNMTDAEKLYALYEDGKIVSPFMLEDCIWRYASDVVTTGDNGEQRLLDGFEIREVTPCHMNNFVVT